MRVLIIALAAWGLAAQTTRTGPGTPAQTTGYVRSFAARAGIVVPQEGDYLFDQLGDVTITNPINGECIVRVGGVWVNSTCEPTITAGTIGQYWRGDKTWQTLDKAAVGLGNVENTALSTWAGSVNLTTLGTVTAGSFPWANLTGVPATFAPSVHAASHQFGGADLVATATPGANAIPQADALGKLAVGWIPDLSSIYAALAHTHLAANVTDFGSAARALFSGVAPISYDSGTGAFTFAWTRTGTSTELATWSGPKTPGCVEMDANGNQITTGVGCPTGGGDVVGPSSSSDNYIVVFDLTTGKAIKQNVGNCRITVADGLVCGDGTNVGRLTLKELAVNGANFRRFSVPDALTADWEMNFHDAVPTEPSFLVWPVPTLGKSTSTFGTFRGNTAVAASVSGTLTNGNFIKADANQNLVDGGSAYTTVQDEGSGLTPRPTLNLIGAGVTCADNPGSTRTDCTVPGGGSSQVDWQKAAAPVSIAAASTNYTLYSTASVSLAAGACLHISAGWQHTAGSTGLVYKIRVGTTDVSTPSASASTALFGAEFLLCNDPGSQSAQTNIQTYKHAGTTDAGPATETSAVDWSSPQTVSLVAFTSSVPSGDEVTPMWWRIE